MEHKSDTLYTIILIIYILLELASFVASSKGLSPYLPGIAAWLNNLFA